jgi:hypothetical protein
MWLGNRVSFPVYISMMPRDGAILIKIRTHIISIMASIPYLDRVIQKFAAFKIASIGFEAVPVSADDPYFDEQEKCVSVEDPSETHRNRSGPGFTCYAALVLAGLAMFLFAENVRLRRHGSLQTGYAGELGLFYSYISSRGPQVANKGL